MGIRNLLVLGRNLVGFVIAVWLMFSASISSASDVLPPISEPPPVSERILRPHPRLFINQQMLPKLREKLAAPVYAEDLEVLRDSNNPTDQAFLYVVFGDKTAGEAAKRALLSAKIPEWGGLEKRIRSIQAAVMYDWLYDMLSPSEREQAIGVLKNIIQKDLTRLEDQGVQYYFNDMWARGPAFVTVVALALSGDDKWADKVVASAYRDPKKAFSPYLGGAIDALNTIAADTGGGHQVGITGQPGSGYESMFLIGAGLFINAWQSATGEDIVSRTRYFELFPYYLTYAYLNVTPFGEAALQTLEYITGIAPEQSASLAHWLINHQGRAKYALVFRLILGDLTRSVPRSPEELALPLATYLQGADLVVSRTGWSENDLSVFMFARYWDFARFEPESGGVSIYLGGEPLLVRGILGKSIYGHYSNSSLWIWRDGRMAKTLGQGSTYKNKLNNLDRHTERALTAADVLDPDKAEYRPETLVDFSVGVEGVRATTRYERLLKLEGVKRAERTLHHQGNRVRILDELEAPKGTRVAWSLRLPEAPVIDGQTITTSNLKITLLHPKANVYWSGGEGKELLGPSGEWHGSNKHGYTAGYSVSAEKASHYGIGYVFAEPVDQSGRYTFEALLEIVR